MCGAFGTIAHQPYAACLRGPVTSNVRPHMHRHWRIRLTLALVVVLLSACTAKYRDVSYEQPYSKYPDKVCVVAQELQAQGIALNYERARGTEYVVVTVPLAKRSYTTFVRDVRPGTLFRILEVRRCTNCQFDEMVQFRVTFEPEPTEFKGKPVYLQRFDALEKVANCR